MTAAPTVHVVWPAGVADPATPSGGNSYDRRVGQGLAESGWSVRQLSAAGAWPWPAPADRDALARTLAVLPDRAVVLVDGLVAGPAPEVLAAESQRLRLVVLVHLPLAAETGLTEAQAAQLDEWERRSLHAATAVVATSAWAARRLVDHHGLPAARVHVAAPGVDPAPLAPGSDTGARLVCVAAVTPRKGQDLLVEALARLTDLPWTCVCAGSLDRAPAYADRVRELVRAHRLDDRVQLVGPRTGDQLAATYAAADLAVLASHAETYGMVVTEALARGVPVLATDVDGLPEALGQAPDGSRPGMLVPPADPPALAEALRRWLTEPDTRDRLRAAARARRAALPGWEVTVRRLAGVLARLAAAPHPAPTTHRPDLLDPAHVTRPASPRAADQPRFSPTWLELREDADAAARAAELLDPIRDRLAAGTPLAIHDLGCGTGSMGRWLAGRLPGPQHWHLYDRDPDLLRFAATHLPGTAADGSPVTATARHRDITALAASDLTTGLVTASALLDLLTRDEVARLAAACLGAGCPALLTLSVSGQVELTPADPLDTEIGAAFDAHQRRRTGGRRLLGPDAVDAAAEAFTDLGATVQVRPSPWRLGPDHAGLMTEWLRGWVDAACEQRPDLAAPAAGYLERRLAAAAAGELRALVGHQDLLAYPG